MAPVRSISATRRLGRLDLKRNPNYYDKERPFIDEIQRPIIPEYANALAQFRTGNLLDMTVDARKIRAEDILPTKQTFRRSTCTS